MGQDMFEQVSKTNKNAKYFCLEGMRIEPCYACRACNEKTNGKCIIRDDADIILPYIARSKAIIIFTPIVYGGYSFQIKRIIDKFSLIMDNHYRFYKGELVKGNSAGVNYHVIGVQDGNDTEEASVFKQFIAETRNIVSWTGQTIIMPRDAAGYDALIQEIIE